MPHRFSLRTTAGATLLLAAHVVVPGVSMPAMAQQTEGSFAKGPCSGLLCDYIGGAQAPAAQKQSLFPEGECGGVLCGAIGGAQAPKRNDPPPPCGGGLLCDMMPYAMAVPVTAAEAARRQNAQPQDDADRQRTEAAAAEAEKPKPRARKRKGAKTAAEPTR